MANVYDNVAELQTQVAALQSTVARWKIESDVDIVMVFAENQSEATHWFGLDTNFLVD